MFRSPHDDTDDALASAYQLGAVDFLRKPLKPEVIRAKVAVFVELYLRGERIKAQESELERERLQVGGGWIGNVWAVRLGALHPSRVGRVVREGEEGARHAGQVRVERVTDGGTEG